MLGMISIILLQMIYGASCDLQKRSESFQWTPVPNMVFCMYGYDPFLMDPLIPGQPDPGIKKQIFEPTFYDRKRKTISVSTNIHHAVDIQCKVKQETSIIRTMTDLYSSMSGAYSFSEKTSSSSNLKEMGIKRRRILFFC